MSDNNKIEHYEYKDGYEEFYQYDENHNLIHHWDNDNYKVWWRYDEDNNEIHYKNNKGEERWYKYDEHNKQTINITEQEFKQIERIKLLLNNKRCSRFEIMDI